MKQDYRGDDSDRWLPPPCAFVADQDKVEESKNTWGEKGIVEELADDGDRG